MKVTVQDDDDNIIAEINVNRLDERYPDSPLGLYQVRYAVVRDKQMYGLHQRRLSGFERLRFNALGLLKAALDLLGDSELELEYGARPCDLAGGFRGARQALPSQAEDPFNHH